MSTRNAKGATLALVAASVVIIILVGVGLFFLMQLFGGFRELQHATDAGNLNVAKQALLTPNYDLASEQQNEFQGLIDADTQKMNLLTYDRCYGQALLVALNAASDRDPQSDADPAKQKPSKLGLDNAKAVAQICNYGSSSSSKGVGRQMYDLLSSQSDSALFKKFDFVSNRNSTRMLGSDGKLDHREQSFDVAFMEPGGPTNVYIDNNILPFIGQTNTKASLPSTADSGKTRGADKYLAGYRKVNFNVNGNTGNVAFDLIGVPVFPGKQPHLVSGRDFQAAKTANDATFQDLVPPNAFKSVTNSAVNSVSTSQQTARAESYAIVGVLDRDFEVSIPRGYIEIFNPDGIGGNPQPPPNDVYNKELMTGIFLAKTEPTGVAFSTDEKLLKDWADYNKKADADKSQADYDKLVDRSYDKDNNPKVNFKPESNSFENIKEPGSGGKNACYWQDVRGANKSAPCTNLEGDFNKKYPGGETTGSGDKSALTTVEKLKENVVQLYNSQSWDAAPDGKCGTLGCPSPSESGLRYWDFKDHRLTGPVHHQGAAARGANAATAAGASYKISRAGTLNEMFSLFDNTDQGGGASATVKRQIIQRMREVDPNLTDAQADTLFDNGPKLELNTTHYIYKADGVWKFDNAAPPARTLTGARTPDGSLQRWTVKYPTVNLLVNSVHEQGIHQQYYTDTSAQTKAVDVLDLQLSSGRGNLLGKLSFRNFCGGALADNAGSTYYCAPD